MDLAGSSLDPKRRIRLSHCALYVISLSFLIILGLSLSYQINFNSAYIEAKDHLLETLNNQVHLEQSLLVSKFLLLIGSSAFSSFFGYADSLPYITDMLQSFPSYDYHDHLSLYSEIFPNCANDSDLTSFAEKYC